MNETYRRLYTSLAVMITLALVLGAPLSASAQTRTPPSSSFVGGLLKGVPKPEKRLPLERDKREKIEKDAEKIAASLIFEKKEKKVRYDGVKAKGLDKTHLDLLDRFVADLNSGEIGIAIVQEDGSTIVYGNEKALDQGAGPESAIGLDELSSKVKKQSSIQSLVTSQSTRAAWVDRYGVHLYLNEWWTNQLYWLNNWVIGTVAAAIIAAIWELGPVAAAAVALVVNWVWDQLIWAIIRPYAPNSVTIHAPWWGWVHVQVWRNGAWYNGYWIRTNLWT